MRSVVNQSLFLGLVSTLALQTPGAAANTDVTVSGEVRARTEVDGRAFAPGAATLQYTDLRSRVAIHAAVEERLHAYLQFQDSRRLGSLTRDGDPASGLLNDGRNVDLHQAYVRADRLWADGPGIQAGRFEVNLGNQRVFGSVGWHNIGRSWEGLKAWYPRSQVETTAYWLKRLERNDPAGNRDFDIYGLTARIPSANLELLAFLEHDAAPVQGDSTTNALDRIDLGLHYALRSGSVDVIVNAVYQTGTRTIPALTSPVEQDLAAFLVTGEIGYRLEGKGKARLAAGFDYASGDDDPADDTFRAYDNLYYTGHKFRGFMDYFLGSSDQGLLDLVARGSVQPETGWTLKGDLHYFRTAQDYQDFRLEQVSSVGVEVDLGVTTTRVPGVKIDGGAALFLPSESYAGTTDKDAGLWFYGMMTAAFGGK